MFSTPVILCPVHRIFRQRVPNLVHKFAILLHKYRFTQDSRNKSENDGGLRRLLNTICKFFKFPSPTRGEVNGLLRVARNDDRQGDVGMSMIEMQGVLAIIAVLNVGGTDSVSLVLFLKTI